MKEQIQNSMEREEIERIFRERGVLREGHFLLSSGRHSKFYFEKFQILQYPTDTGKLCSEIAKHFSSYKINVVAGPTTGGLILAFEVARQMGVRAIYAEKVGEKREFLRGMEIKAGERVLIVDDILTTGGSVLETKVAVEDCGGIVVGIGVLIDRSENEVKLGVPIFSLFKKSVETFLKEGCPLCKKGIPLVTPGSSKR